MRELAWACGRMKEAELAKASEKAPEAVTLKPGFYGMNADLKEVWRRIWPHPQGRRADPRRRRDSAT